MADTDGRSSLPSSESCDKWMPSEEDICPTGTIKWNHNCMHQQRILSLRQFCPTTNHFLFIVQKHFSPSGDKERKVGGGGLGQWPRAHSLLQELLLSLPSSSGMKISSRRNISIASVSWRKKYLQQPLQDSIFFRQKDLQQCIYRVCSYTLDLRRNIAASGQSQLSRESLRLKIILEICMQYPGNTEKHMSRS